MTMFRTGPRVALIAITSLLAVTACSGDPAEVATSERPTTPDRPGLPAAPDEPGRARDVAADGDVGDRVVTVADTDEPAVSNLDPDLLAALQDATDDAAEDGITIQINSGWRDTDYQNRLLDEAIEEHGSREEALRWVSTPDESAHVTGDAVDVGPTDAAYWMSRYGSDYGLCQTFANEIWHYELTVEPGGSCPPPRSDSAS
ncbi:M15 family metallopeptidase [Jiangella alba]|uniref:D-alanyl-D-alanine carboxypeptidase n=1 Tax=Jiangella alba TaxID=561176 RepID=A0A1H5PYK3_9ACTN|nr:M15 family metallopeptidase [Jiangella alba]SEF18789.1 D-alanyl-D-alanine carboxypeptidase [Jiangella alba]